MSSHSHAATRAATESTTIATSGPRIVFAQVATEVAKVAESAEALGVQVSTNVRAAIVDAAVFALLNLIYALHIELHCNGELVREYRFVIADSAQPAAGPPPEQPPLAASFPPGTQLRITISRNPAVPQETYAAYLAERNWTATTALRVPDGTRKERYGAFSADGYTVERYLLTSPIRDAYDPNARESNESY